MSERQQMIARLVEEARAAYERLSPVDQAIHDDEQRRSFIRGNTGIDPGESPLVAEIARLRAEVAALRAQVSELNLEKLALIDAAEIAELPGIGLGERGA